MDGWKNLVWNCILFWGRKSTEKTTERKERRFRAVSVRAFSLLRFKVFDFFRLLFSIVCQRSVGFPHTKQKERG